MADAVVGFLLHNIKQLLVDNSKLIYDVKDQVKSLSDELRLMKAFLKDSKERRSEHEVVRELVRQIIALAYEAEDAIDTFVVNAGRKRSTIEKVAYLWKDTLKRRSIAKSIEEIKKRMKEIYDTKKFGIEAVYAGESSNEPSSKRRKHVAEKDNVVGFEDEENDIVSQLTNISESLEVFSVVGMGGLGKTTLVKKVFCNPATEIHFVVRAFVYVSQEYNRKEVLFSILSSLMQPSEETYRLNEEMLVEQICKYLKDKKYLIVLDDVWTIDAWNDLKMAFPNQNHGSRILLTTRNREVALLANPNTTPHDLQFLNNNESWELFSKIVFGTGSCPPELLELGNTIAKKCYGLPLAIVVVAGLLLKKNKTRDLWKRVAESVSSYVARDPKQCMEVLALSYKYLPDHLKVCFIYFGAFPEDFSIPVWNLRMLWVAEGFIELNDQDCLEDLADEYLEDLVERNLVIVEKRRSNGRIKTCRIHDMLRDLCLREAADEYFLQVVKVSSGNYDKHRRLCVHSNVMNFIRSKPRCKRVRSFLCFTSEGGELSRGECASFFDDSFKLIRVLDMRSIRISGFPPGIQDLLNLRYIALCGKFKILPQSISKLSNLQSLIVETTSRDLDIQVDIWKMKQFRHLRTNVSSLLLKPEANCEDPFAESKIQTLSTISPHSCTNNILAKTPNLKNLGIRGNLLVLMEEKFSNLTKLDKLDSLKLMNEAYPLPPSDVKLQCLPPLDKFPPQLRKLTLSDTFLDWRHMSIIGSLPNLEVLKLKVYAFQGPEWETLDGGFSLLRVLEIGKTDLVNWKASAHHFPRIEHIVVDQCDKLVAIPHGLADAAALKTIEMYHTPSAIASARIIEQKRKTQQQQPLHIRSNGFKLLIYPPL